MQTISIYLPGANGRMCHSHDCTVMLQHLDLRRCVVLVDGSERESETSGPCTCKLRRPSLTRLEWDIRMRLAKTSVSQALLNRPQRFSSEDVLARGVLDLSAR